MDSALPEAKRQRMSAASEHAWAMGGEGHILPPMRAPQALPQYPQQHSPYSRPTTGPPIHHHIDDRRPAIDSPYASRIHDAHRDMPGGHMPYSEHAHQQSRDHGLKRDTSSEPGILQVGRPNSTGHASDPYMNSHSEEQRRQTAPIYEGAPSQQPPPSAYRPPTSSYAHPLQTTAPSYEAPYGQPPPTPVYGGSAPPYSNSPVAGTRRKAPRTSQACGQCRAAKAKCDDPKPCTTCVKQGIHCDFKPPEPKQADKIQAELLEKMEKMHSLMEMIISDNNETKRQWNKQWNGLEKQVTSIQMKMEVPVSRSANITPKLESPARSDGYISQSNPLDTTEVSNTNSQQHRMNLEYSPEQDLTESEQQDEEEEAKPARFPKNDPSLPSDHTTSATRMLEWRSVKRHLGEYMARDRLIQNYTYSTRREIKRGLLKLHGRGEEPQSANRMPEGYSLQDPSPDQTTADCALDDGASETSSTPAVDAWAPSDGLTPPGPIPHKVVEERRGGSDGAKTFHLPDYDKETVERLVKSYMRHMNCMHPIIFPRTLDRLLKNFFRSFNTREPGKKGGAYYALFTGSNESRVKANNDAESPPVQIVRTGEPAKTVDNALVLCMLALGKICEHKSSIPLTTAELDENSMQRNGHPSPLQVSQSPGITSSSSLSSPREGGRFLGGRRPSLTENMSSKTVSRLQSRPRNQDVIPGLAYFVAATEIIGNQIGGNTLRHVHLGILASLYHGQLARVSESHSYLFNACRALQVILLRNSDRYKAIAGLKFPIGERKDIPVLVAFWTCLQLESDLIAELDFPQSGILSWESSMPTIDAMHLKSYGVSDLVIHSYLGQLHMRKRLNDIHKESYKGGKEDEYQLPVEPEAARRLVGVIAATLKMIGGAQPISADARDDLYVVRILQERLEGKKYGALNITYRPCLMMVMNRPDDFPVEEIDQQIMYYAKLCLEAMVNSTSMFAMHNNERLIITNPWGTAHAQWGNCIALQAAWMDPVLRPFIDEATLTQLIQKTLAFLYIINQPSSAIAQDIKILEFMADKVTGLVRKTRPEQTVSSSFTSNGSYDQSPP